MRNCTAINSEVNNIRSGSAITVTQKDKCTDAYRKALKIFRTKPYGMKTQDEIDAEKENK